MYTCLCSCRNLLQKGNGWHSREDSMIRETDFCTAPEREKDRANNRWGKNSRKVWCISGWKGKKQRELNWHYEYSSDEKEDIVLPYKWYTLKSWLYDRWRLRTRHILRQRPIGNTVSNTDKIIQWPKIKTQPTIRVIKMTSWSLRKVLDVAFCRKIKSNYKWLLLSF